MPVHYRIDGDVVIIQPVGAHATAELREAWLKAEADPSYPTPSSRLRICVDTRGSESLGKHSMAETRATVSWFVQRARMSSRICAFITRPGLHYGMARMMAAWIEYKGFSAFVTTSPEQAVEWLKDQPASSTSGAA